MKNTHVHDKRKFERIPVDMDVCFFADDGIHFGRIIDCSADGMHMETCIHEPVSPELRIMLPHRNRLLNVPFNVVRIKKRSATASELGLQIHSESKQYLEFALSRSLGLPA